MARLTKLINNTNADLRLCGIEDAICKAIRAGGAIPELPKEIADLFRVKQGAPGVWTVEWANTPGGCGEWDD